MSGPGKSGVVLLLKQHLLRFNMGYPSPPPRNRRFWRRVGAWWRRKRRKYHVVTDASTDPAAEATRRLMNISTETPDDEEPIFEVIAEAQPEAPLPRQGSSKQRPLIQAVPAVPPPRIPVLLPPLPPNKVPSFLPSNLSRQSSIASPEPFIRRRTRDSFQGSLESIDSLIESYWDPEEDVSLSTPLATNTVRSMDFLEEHVDFLKVQTQPRSVEVVWQTEGNWEQDDLSS